MDLHQLRTFIAIADTGGVARAAAKINLSQSAVSRQIQILEAELDVLLFDRIGRHVKLTSEGEDLLRRGRRLIADAVAFRERARALKSGDAGQIKIGATPPLIETALAAFLPGYGGRHPRVSVHIVEDGGAGLASRLERGEVHVAYVPVGNERFTGPLLYPIHVTAVVPDGHPLHRRRTLEIGELRSHPLLLLRRSFASREWFDAACRAANLDPNLLLESSAPNAVVQLVVAGYGIAILPSFVRLPKKGVRAIPLVHNDASIGKWTMLARDSQRFLAPYVMVFMDEFLTYAQRTFPGRDVIRRAPHLNRPPRAHND